ncbi:MAG TPA: AMP-binding protein, partial [Puia sp.]|nr:AMP-binding protein [Puia sp.]
MPSKSYAYGIGQHPLLGETIGENLRNTCNQYPERPALICVHQQYRVSYAEFWKQVETVAKSFLAINVQKGDRVA